MSRPATIAAAAAMIVLYGCEESPRPWSAPPNRSVIDESQPFLPSSGHDGWLVDAGLDEFLDAGEPDDAATGPVPPESHVGGLWAGCHQGFRVTQNPTRDVTRLGLICGPVTGMKRLGKTATGSVSPGEPGVHEIEAVAGGCYRLFAAANGVAVLDVVVATPSGTVIARDDGKRPWAVVDPDRPVCTFDADRLVVNVTSRRGSGPYALQVWQLPPRKSR